MSEDEWKAIREFEGVLRESSRLTEICQNEEKLNSACGPVMRKALHDSSSRDAMSLIDVDDWSSNKEETHPTRSEVKVESFAVAVKICRKRALLETERRFFNNKTEVTVVQSNAEIEIKLTDREKASLALDPRNAWNEQVFHDATMWNNYKDEFKYLYRECCVQTNSFYRQNNNDDHNSPSPDRAKTHESGDSE